METQTLMHLAPHGQARGAGQGGPLEVGRLLREEDGPRAGFGRCWRKIMQALLGKTHLHHSQGRLQ